MKISILGAGTWGIALARMLSNNNHDILVYSKIKEEIINLDKYKAHPNLSKMVIPDSISFTDNIKKACLNQDIILCAIPSIYLRSIMKEAKDYINDNQLIVDVAKGIEEDTLYTMSQVIEDELKGINVRVVALSGPTHAEEVAKDLPTTIISAAKDLKDAQIVQDIFTNTCMRVYTNDDILGVELSGALKNIIALAAGISSGLGNGDNAKAAIITRGIAEITRLGVRMGAKKETFAGLSGIGDLIVTATSIHSRNNRCGFLIGQGIKPKDAIKEIGMVVEGINALPGAIQLMKKYDVDMPIIFTVNQIINEKISPKDAINLLMQREKKDENY